jgi:siroheme synthase
VATSVRFLTGHSREGGESQLDETLAACADPHTTLIVYMGLGTLPLLVQQLRARGMPADMPAVAVERGTTSDQRLVFDTLQQLHGSIQEAGLKSPTLLVIGEVVALAPGWQSVRGVAAAGALSAAAASAAVTAAHDCARLQLDDAVAAVLQRQRQQQQQAWQHTASS